MATHAAHSWHGARTFLPVWFGQLISLTGSGMTEFGLSVWVFQRTGSETQFAVTFLCIALPRIVLAPLAGALVDRWDRRRAMLLSDTGAALVTLSIALLLSVERLEVWHVYLATTISSALGAFQRPAYTATITLLIPKQHYGRASGLVSLARSIPSLVSPALAGFLIGAVGLAGVVVIDFATFLFAAVTLLLVRFPRPPVSAEGAAARGSVLREAAAGWAYIARRPGLLGLTIFYAATHFLGVTTEVLLTPYMLSFTTADALGLVVSATGAGLLAGGFVMSAWGGPKRRVRGILGFELLIAVCTILMGLRASPVLIGAAAFAYFAGIELGDGSGQALWQSKVAPDFQGRVFAMQDMVALSALPLGILITAPLAEFVFEPALSENGALAGSLGQVIGVGPGRGIGLVFILTGLFNLAAIAAAYLHPRIRHVEDELPDAVEQVALAEPDAA